MTGAGFDGVDLDLLADYIGGALIGTPDDERVGTLVADDPVWREAYERLAPGMVTVGAMLRDLPAETMPADLSARFDSLFVTADVVAQAEGVTAVDAVGESANPVPKKVIDLAEAQRARAAGARPRRRLRWAAPISVAAGVLAFAGFGLSQISGGDATDSGASESAADGTAPMIAAAPSVGQILHSGRDYDLGSLSEVPAIADTFDSRASSDAPTAATAEPGYGAASKGTLSRLLLPDALANCLEAITRENAGGALAVTSIDYAMFTGVPALIVHFTAANGGWAWAVGADCGAPGADADALGRVPVR